MSDVGWRDPSVKIAKALAPFVGQSVTLELVDTMVEALRDLCDPTLRSVSVDPGADVDALRRTMLANKGPGNFSHLFVNDLRPPTVEEIIDEQWLAFMGSGKEPALIVMREADCRWLDATMRGHTHIPPHIPPFNMTFRGIPIEIDEEYDKPKLLSPAQVKIRRRR